MRAFPPTLPVAFALALAACQSPAPLPRVAAASPPRALAMDFVFDHAPYPYAHTATLAEAAPGEIVAAWSGGTAEKDRTVGIWSARWTAAGPGRADGRWSAMREIASGDQPDGSRLSSWNPVLFKLRSGSLVLFYKVGPSPHDWHGMMKRSEDGGRTWGPPVALPDGVVGPAKDKPLELPDGSWLAGSSREDGASGWRIRFEKSKDQGATWQMSAPAGSDWTGPVFGRAFAAIQPTLLVHPDGRLQALCRTRNGVLATTWSADQGASWSPLAATTLPNPNSGVDAVTLADGRHLLVYNPSGRALLGFGWGWRWPLAVAVSADGAHWRHVMTLESEPTTAGYAYPSVIQASDGLVHVVYSWKRERIRHAVLDPREW